MFERSIGIRLVLSPVFAEATKLIVSNTREINKSLQSINETGNKINAKGLLTLNAELMNLVGAANAAKQAIQELNGIKITKNALSALELGMQEVAKSAKITKQDIQSVGVQAEQTAKIIETSTNEASRSFFDLNAEIMKAEAALAKLGMHALPTMAEPIISMRTLGSEIALAEQAMRKLDSFAPRQLEDSILRLNSGLQNLRMLAGGGPAPLMLPAGPTPWATGSSQYGVRPMSLGAGAAPEQRPWTSVTGNSPYMLSSGNWSGNDITPYGSSPARPQSTPYEPGNGYQQYEGPGAITPYVQNIQGQYIGREQEGSGPIFNYGQRPPVDYGGEKVSQVSRGVMRTGDIMQSGGWGGFMNYIMGAAVAEPMIKQQTDLQDLYGVAGEALQAVGAKPKNYQNIMAGAEDASTKYGGSLRENVSGMYTFASSAPALSHIDWNDPKQQELMKQAYEKITEGGIVGGRSTHPVSQEHSILDIMASVSNLGMPMANAKELANSIKTLTDVFTNVKNSTSTDFDLLGSTIRNVGAVAHNMGVSWQDTMALTGLLAEGKYRGSIAGTSIKRIFSRQAMDTKQARDMEAMVAKFGGNVSMFDQHGKTLSPLDFFANIAKFEDQHHLVPKARAKLEGSLSGLYAGAPMGEMVNLARAFGGSAGLKKYEQTLVGGAPGATDRAYQTRDQGGKNVSIESKKIDNSWQLEMHKTFLLMNGDIINFLHGVQDLIKMWHGLSDPVKKTIVDFGAVSVIGSGLIGVVGIMGGNFLKLGGTMLYAGGMALKLGEHLMGQSVIFPRFAMGIEKLGQVTIGILPAAFTAARIATTSFLVALGPVGWTIAAIGIAASTLAVAWSKDWGGIREKVRDFPEFLGEVVGRAGVWFHHIPQHLQDAGNSLKMIWQGIWNDITHIISGAFSIIDDIFVKHKFPEIHWPTMPDWFKTFGAHYNAGVAKGTGEEATAEGITNGTGDGGKSGQAFAQTYGDGAVSGLASAKQKIKTQGLQPIRDLYPFSEPRDSSSPLAGMAKSGTAFSDDFINAAIMGLGSGAKKVKKAAKPVGDVFMELKSESVNQVIEMASAIEKELAIAGAVIKERWIDLYNPQTHQITRTHGDVQAFHLALGSNVHDTSVQQARDYLEKMKREIKAGLPVDIDKAIANLTSLSVHALSAHAMSEINQMISVLKIAAEKAGNTINSAFKTNKGSFDTSLEATTRQGNRFDLTQQEMGEKVPELESDPTTKNLKSVIAAETSERNALASVLLNESEDAGELSKKYQQLNDDIAKLNGTSSYEKQIRDGLIQQLNQVTQEYDAANSRIIQQKTVVDNLTGSIQQQSNALKIAKDTWNGLMYSVQQSSMKSMLDGNFKSIADHVQNYFQLQNSPNGPAGNSAARQGANNYANNMTQELFHNLFGESSNSVLEKITHKGNAKEGIQGTTQYIERVDKSNDLLSKIDKNTQYLDPKNVSKIEAPPTDVVIRPDGGGATDLGTQIADGIASTKPNSITSELQSQQHSMYQGALDNMPNGTQDTLKSFQDMAGEASAAFGLYQGLKAGGVGGAVQAGSSAYEMTGNPYIAGAAAVIGFIGIGPHTTPEQTPDQSDATYRQLLPNWSGTQQTMAGNVVQPNAQFSTYNGSQSEAAQMYAFISNPSATTGMNPAQITAMQQMQALAVTKSGQNMGAAGLAITGEKQGVLTFASGQTMKVSDFETLVNTNQGILTQLQNNALQQQQDADRLASSFTSFVIGGPSGFIMPDFVGGGSGSGRMPSTVAANNIRTTNMGMPAIGASGNGSLTTPGSIQISILAGATINEASQAKVEAAIQSKLPEIAQAVNGQNYDQDRLSGAYTSNNW